MSHFTVLVITDQPGEDAVTKALAPYHEFECTGQDDEYVTDVDITDECRKDFDQRTEKESFSEFIKDYHGYSLAQSNGGVATLLKEHTFGYFLLGPDGEVSKVVRRTNPNKQWDWWQIGGRWTGFFKTKPAVCGIVGSPGLMTSKAKPGYADQVFKSDIDIEGMRDEAVAKAEQNYNLYHAAVDKHPPIIPWSVMRDEKCPGNIDLARQRYHAQPGIIALHANNETRWFEPDRFTLDLQGHCLRARNKAMQTFAVLKDGTWFERGSMGWWGMVADEVSEDEWSTQFAMLIDTLPDTAVLTLVDCHI